MTLVTFRTRGTLFKKQQQLFCCLIEKEDGKNVPMDHQLPSCQQDRVHQDLREDQPVRVHQGIRAHHEVRWRRVSRKHLEGQVHHLYQGYQEFRRHQVVPNKIRFNE